MSGQDVQVDSVVPGGVGRRQGGGLVSGLLVRGALDCDDSEIRKQLLRQRGQTERVQLVLLLGQGHFLQATFRALISSGKLEGFYI